MYKSVTCEFCREPIDETYCILFPLDRRGVHIACMRERLGKTFKNIVGARDDDIEDMVVESIIDALMDVTPMEADDEYNGNG